MMQEREHDNPFVPYADYTPSQASSAHFASSSPYNGPHAPGPLTGGAAASFHDDPVYRSYPPAMSPSPNNSGALLGAAGPAGGYASGYPDHRAISSTAGGGRGDRRKRLLPFTVLGILVVVVLAVVLPVYFVVIKPHQKHSSNNSDASTSGGSSTGAGTTTTKSGVTTGGDGSTVTTSSGETFVYSNKFGGYWVENLDDPFNDDAAPNDWTPPLNTTWDWGVNKIYGVNLGGWFVLEPFITPALFQKYPSAPDEWTLTQLMAADGTLQSTMENHYDTFITEQDIAQIAGAGLNWVRVPIPFWAISTWSDVGVAPDGTGGATTTTVAEPFLEGVVWKYIIRMLGWARKYGLRVNLDLHTIPGSQNGYNHSGKFGQVNFLNGQMGVANAQRALDYIRTITEFISQPEWKNLIPVFGIVNEALLHTIGRPQLTSFYLEAHDMIRGITGYGEGNGPYISIHDGFDGVPNWAGFLQGSDRIILDTHPYFAFDGSPNDAPIATGTDPSNAGGIWPKQACNAWGPSINTSRTAFGVTIAGEFSNGYNDCGLFLNGISATARYGGDCSVWQDSTNWNVTVKAGLMQFALASMDAMQDWFFWTWKIGNATSGIVEAPLWSYQLGLEGGWMPTDPRTAAGTCAQLGVDSAPFDGVFSAWQTGGAGAGTISPESISSFGQYPPATISNVDAAALGFLPTYTATAGLVTLTYTTPPASVTPTPTPTVSVGNGWVDPSDTASFVTAVAGCTYPDAWSALSMPPPTAACTGS
ncbi:glycoside hydrolase family 5 protein [Roridomyces roridus]|uniref:glucan 1,3-beta-glucosidase n=1 Tax=Roridomyces roridus TaxID=1738132 RepID=A0AAD7FHM2_9AGAR|nr:glycoside hydrolase family 5 protein [Roridomyces roridus]